MFWRHGNIGGTANGSKQVMATSRRITRLVAALMVALPTGLLLPHAGSEAAVSNPPAPEARPAKVKPKTRATQPAPAPSKPAATTPVGKPAAKTAKAVPVPEPRPQGGETAAAVFSAPVPVRRPEDLPTGFNDPRSRSYGPAFENARAGRWDALAAPRVPFDPYLEKVLSWLALTGARTASFAEVVAFMEANPGWPGQRDLRRQAERAIDDGVPVARRVAWLKANPPLTTEGRLALIAALDQAGLRQDMISLVRETWRDTDFGTSDQRAFLARWRAHLGPDDHWARLDSLLWLGRTGSAQAMVPLVDPDRRRLAGARIKLRTMTGNVDGAVGRVPEALRNDPGLVYERVRWRNRKGLESMARELLWDAAPSAQHVGLWWNERARQIRYALDENAFADAYLLAAGHVQQGGLKYAEAEWHAGWVALRFAGKPAEALNYFQNLHEDVTTPISQARMAYWAGRASEDAGNQKVALNWYRQAADHVTTFYGQLAAARLPNKVAALPLDPRPTATDERAFAALEVPQAAEALAAIGERRLSEQFLRAAADQVKSTGQAVLLARLAERIHSVRMSVELARRMARYGYILVEAGYPTIAMPEGAGPEEALTLAVIRQESAFDIGAVSSAGARGLMQLMPATARNVARGSGMHYSSPLLTEDPDYNLRLGRTYLQAMLERFDGNYALALAAYNAGPARVDSWIQKRGDPRSPAVDIIDWIERIPFSETRNYVQRVLEGLQVYRLRLAHQPGRASRAGDGTVDTLAAPAAARQNPWCSDPCGPRLASRQPDGTLPSGILKD